jgi:DNA-binding NarL/FixJ family response regulator
MPLDRESGSPFDGNDQVSFEEIAVQIPPNRLSKALKTCFTDMSEVITKLFDQSPVGIAVIDYKGVFLSMNSAYCEVCGYLENELIGQIFTKLFAPYDRARALESHQPSVLIFTMHPADQYLKHVVTLGARGFMSKDSHASKIIGGIDAILSGRTAFPVDQGDAFNRKGKSLGKAVGPLSKREDEVLRALVQGERNGDIAQRLKISAKTVSTYRTRILEKLNVENNAELVALAIQTGLVVARQ